MFSEADDFHTGIIAYVGGFVVFKTEEIPIVNWYRALSLVKGHRLQIRHDEYVEHPVLHLVFAGRVDHSISDFLHLFKNT